MLDHVFPLVVQQTEGLVPVFKSTPELRRRTTFYFPHADETFLPDVSDRTSHYIRHIQSELNLHGLKHDIKQHTVVGHRPSLTSKRSSTIYSPATNEETFIPDDPDHSAVYLRHIQSELNMRILKYDIDQHILETSRPIPGLPKEQPERFYAKYKEGLRVPKFQDKRYYPKYTVDLVGVFPNFVEEEAKARPKQNPRVNKFFSKVQKAVSKLKLW